MELNRLAVIGCERSGQLRRAFQAVGWRAISIDTARSDDGAGFNGVTGGHIVGDLFEVLDTLPVPDLFIVHPPCTYLCGSGLHWNSRRPGRAQLTADALEFVARCWAVPATRKALENPQGCINTRLPDMPRPQYIQPYQFGDDASKKTGLWLHNLPPLALGTRVPGRLVQCSNGKVVERWANQTDSGQNRLGPSDTRAAERSQTYPGIAAAMAAQWGSLPY